MALTVVQRILLYCLWFLRVTINADFIVSPTSQTVPIEEDAEFRCQHDSADILRWRVNGSLISLSNRPDGVQFGVADPVITLTIPAFLEYNGTEVVCVAQFDSGSPDQESNPPAILFVSVSTSNATTTTTTTTTLPTIPPGFLEYPTSVNLTVGQRITFLCRHSAADTIGWSVNDVTSLGELSNMNINISEIHVFSNGSVQNTLSLIALNERNGSLLECSALFHNASSEFSPEFVMLVQGPLNAPNNLKINLTVITWDPPFSLDLTSVDPDIVYCVEIYNITCGMRDLLVSHNNVSGSNYNSSILLPGYLHEVKITPRSNVAGSVNGTSSKIYETFTPFKNINILNSFIIIDNFTLEVNIVLNSTLQSSLDTNRRSPSAYSLLLTSSDGVDSDQVSLVTNTTMESDRRVILMATGHLQTKRRWEITVLAYNCTEHILSYANELSTHAVQAVVYPNALGEIVISGYCIEDSMASGMLVIVYSLDKLSDIHYLQVSCSSETGAASKTLRMSKGPHSISIFSIEKEGLPFDRTAKRPTTALSSGSKEDDVANITFEAVSTDNGVNVTCTFTDTVANYCVAIVHRNVHNINSSVSGLTAIESSHKFVRSGETASGHIEGVNLEDYQVGVIGGRQRQTVDSTRQCGMACVISIVITAVLSVTVFIVIITVVSIVYRRRKFSDHESTENIKTDRCAAYELTQLSRQRVQMEENPAYQETGHYATIN